jgi:hypothetical protein
LKAAEWLHRGHNTNDPFEGLSNYWRGFNNLFAGQRPERELISSFLRVQIDETFAQKLIEANAKDLVTLIQQPVLDMRGNGRDTSIFISQFDGAETAVDKLVALFMIIYQVRCNLEHGQKSPSRDRDRALCKAACPFVAAVVENAA